MEEKENKLSAASYSTKPDRLATVKSKLNSKFPVRPGRSGPRLKVALIPAICLLLGIGGGFAGARLAGVTPGHTSTAVKQQYISDESALIASIAKNVGQSVVSIDVSSQTTATDFFGLSQTTSQASAGTGFIISASGIIVTNRHVVPQGTTSVRVTLADGTRFDNVDVIGRSATASSQDIAFLKIRDLKGKSLTPVTMGDSSKMQVGDRVIAIGNALGQFQNTVTSGIISGYGRDVSAGDQSGLSASESLTDLFQTDAAINEGNSGGPLVNIDGEVIGINTAIASGAQNIGFAQPINDVKGLITSVLNNGQLQQPYLGVRYVSLTDDIAYEFNLSVKRGAYVVSGDNQPAVVPGSPAEQAGLHEKDIITKVNNIAIDSRTNLTSALSQFKPGDKVNLTVVRAGKTISINATLATAPGN